MERNVNCTELNNQNYQKILPSKNLIVLEFYAEWIGSCRIISSALRELAVQFAENQVEFCRVNADKNTKIVNEFGIHSIPSILFVQNGRVMDFISGLVSKSDIENNINKLIKVS